MLEKTTKICARKIRKYVGIANEAFQMIKIALGKRKISLGTCATKYISSINPRIWKWMLDNFLTEILATEMRLYRKILRILMVEHVSHEEVLKENANGNDILT